ncbi:YciI family protein [Nocardioides sp. SR21]|uniref:YciI family protein n=1 Tax=Nocardioides sp. SR21 TaxID=2919501 RepID=UPI001FAA8D1C|nr:YciI family protein [Nocardioides sp. SR21]
MQFFCYHRDRSGSTPLRAAMVEEHWSYMDRFELIARGPTFLDDDTLTGSVHVVEVPDVAAARAFVFDEPSYQAGAYRDVLLRRTSWQSLDPSVTGGYLAIGFLDRPEPYDDLPAPRADLAGFGPLLSDDATRLLGAAALAATEEAARGALSRIAVVESHLWQRGGRR